MKLENRRSLERTIRSVDEKGNIIRVFKTTCEKFTVTEDSELTKYFPLGEYYFNNNFNQSLIEDIATILTDEYNSTVSTNNMFSYHKHILKSARLINPNMEKQLKETVLKFMEDKNITCEETIYQTDRIIEGACDFISELYQIVSCELPQEED